jgi:hypothetical protein
MEVAAGVEMRRPESADSSTARVAIDGARKGVSMLSGIVVVQLVYAAVYHSGMGWSGRNVQVKGLADQVKALPAMAVNMNIYRLRQQYSNLYKKYCTPQDLQSITPAVYSRSCVPYERLQDDKSFPHQVSEQYRRSTTGTTFHTS